MFSLSKPCMHNKKAYHITASPTNIIRKYYIADVNRSREMRVFFVHLETGMKNCSSSNECICNTTGSSKETISQKNYQKMYLF